MINKRTHGLHNMQACNLLYTNGSGEFNDWIITTSFYAALHLVHHEIFPLPVTKRIYSSFEAYYNSEYPNNEVTKHTATKDLVHEYLHTISNEYNWLFKECHNARYRNYNVHERIAKQAKDYIEFIKENTQ